MNDTFIPFHRAHMTGKEAGNISRLLETGNFDSDGYFAKQCAAQLRRITGADHLVLTPSCTDALEMAALLCDIGPGDEVVMPSFTFVSSANPFVLFGGIPVFADIDPRTMNIDPVCVEKAITPKTKALVVTHYGGVAADMEKLLELADKHALLLIEDAAHCIGASWRGRHLGAIGHLGALSFHDTKNIHCAEGGALLVNDARLATRAAVIRDKGTNRSQYLRGQVGQYTWVDRGSSFALSELNAAFLSAQLDDLEQVNTRRRRIWESYTQGLKALTLSGRIELAVLPDEILHNGHVFFLKCKDRSERAALIRFLSDRGVDARFHYVPLHTAPAGLKFGRFFNPDRYTTRDSERLLRLPIYTDLDDQKIQRIVTLIHGFYAGTP